METQTEKYLIAKFSLDELEIDVPSIDLVSKARQKVMARKTKPDNVNHKWNLNFFKFEFTVFHAGFAAIIIVAGVFYLTQQKYQNNYSTSKTETTNVVSSKSNTVLASLTKNDAKASVKSSTVLTSIITFIAKN